MSNRVIKTAVAIILAFFILTIDASAQINIEADGIYKIRFTYTHKHDGFLYSMNTEEKFLEIADDYTTIYNRKHIKQFVKILNSLEESPMENKDYRIMVELIHSTGITTNKMFFTYFGDWGLLYYNNSQMYMSKRRLINFFDKHLYKHWRSAIPPIPKKLLRDKNRKQM